MSAPAYPQPAPLRTRYLLATLGVVLAATAAGVGLRATVEAESPAPKPPRTVAAGPVELTVPGAWSPERITLAGVPGLTAGTTSFAPLPGLRAHALVSLAPIDDPTLVAAPLRALFTEPLVRPRKTSLAGLQAWAYPEVAAHGDRIVQVTVAPTTAGVLTVACLARTSSWLAASGCAGDVGEASLSRATGLTPSPALAYRNRLTQVVERLDRRRALLRAKLRGAPSRRGQARFAARLGRAHALASARLAPWTPATGAPRAVDRALRATGRAYGQMSAAARHGWPRRYRFARRAVRRGDAALSRALARIG